MYEVNNKNPHNPVYQHPFQDQLDKLSSLFAAINHQIPTPQAHQQYLTWVNLKNTEDLLTLLLVIKDEQEQQYRHLSCQYQLDDIISSILKINLNFNITFIDQKQIMQEVISQLN